VSFAPHIWGQLKSITADELIRALERDGWSCDTSGGSMRIFRAPDGKRVSIHYHAQKTYGAKLLKALLGDIGWSEEDMKRVKLL
jgi:predicted RNA binding protein YcfA (HicA-like mRNA interferase family)